MHRRTFLPLLSSLLCFAPPAGAARRTAYGGRVELVLPFDLTRIDPHDPEDLTATLLGPSMFESLFDLTASGAPYPTLLLGDAQEQGGKVQITLRSGLVFSNGKPLTAREVGASLRRSQKAGAFARPLGTIATQGDDKITFSTKDVTTVRRILASPRTAILPPDFSPTSPVGCGALRVRAAGGVGVLERNPRAPRGGSFAAEARLSTGDLRQCLRAFEAQLSDVGFLGAGLYQKREGARAFRLTSPGLVLLRPGKQMSDFARPGVLHAAVSRLGSGTLAAMGVVGSTQPSGRWPGPSMKISVCERESWLNAIAAEVASAWTSSERPVKTEPVARATLTARLGSGSFDAALTFFRTDGMSPREVMEALFLLDGKSAPRGGRVMSPSEAARQLGLGVLGALEPRGYVAPTWNNLTDVRAFNLANCQRADE